MNPNKERLVLTAQYALIELIHLHVLEQLQSGAADTWSFSPQETMTRAAAHFADRVTNASTKCVQELIRQQFMLYVPKDRADAIRFKRISLEDAIECRDRALDVGDVQKQKAAAAARN